MEHTKKTREIERRPRVEARTGMACSTIYKEMAEGRFPRPVKLTGKSVGWYSDEIDEWLASRARATAREAA